MKKTSATINKLQFVSIVAKKLNHRLSFMHIANVISLFLDEWGRQLQIKEKINIPNFGVFKIEKTKPRKYHNINKKRFAVSTGKSLIKIRLSRSLRNKIVENLDLIKTFI